MYLEKTLFAIDNNTDTHVVAKFMRHIDTQKAMGKMSADMIHCIGFWEGALEPSYLLDTVDYERFVKAFGFVDEQECVLRVAGDTRQPCTIDDGKSVVSAGPMQEVTAYEAMRLDAWTYVMVSGKYHKTVEG